MAKTTPNSKEEQKKNEQQVSTNATTPHNDFFGKLMTRKKIAIALFKRALPAHILSIAHFSKLTILESKHIALDGVKLYNDILYSLPLAQEQKAYILLMCEHQSTPHPQMPFRLLKYNVATIDDHLEQGNKHLPVMVNMVFYHGKRPWKYSTALADYYKNRKLGLQYLYTAPFILIELPADREDELYRDKNLGLCFAAFRCTSSPDPYKELSALMDIPVFKEYFKKLAADDRYLMVSYLGKCIRRKGHSLEKLVTLTTNNTKEKEEMMESIAQEYIDRGMKQGRQEGKQEGKQEGRQEEKLSIARTMLHQLKLGLKVVQQATGLSRQELAHL